MSLPIHWTEGTVDSPQAIRAGVIDVTKDPYRFALPPSWKPGKIANIQSGNFCMVGSSFTPCF